MLLMVRATAERYFWSDLCLPRFNVFFLKHTVHLSRKMDGVNATYRILMRGKLFFFCTAAASHLCGESKTLIRGDESGE